ncbi:MAG: tyrosine-type recombinase/integrase [Bacteroidetes bacterium]|nr:tyrosine-type recombinase/integrase [Bacteroidota bacterium]
MEQQATQQLTADQITFWKVWQDYKQNHPLKPSTINLYEYCLRHSLPDWIYSGLKEIKGADVFQKHQTLTKTDAAQADLAFRFVKAIYKFAIAFYDDEEGNPLITVDPTQKLSALRAWNGLKRRTGRIPPEKAATWWQALEELPDAARDHLRLLYLTGMRKKEGSALKWENVDLTAGTMTLMNTKNGSDHVIPFSTYIWDLFKKRHDKKTGPFVFPGTYIDSPLSANDRTYHKVVESTGIHFAPHDLRRGFMSTAAELGLQVYTIKKLLNHSNTDVTYGYYVADINKLRESIQTINDELMRWATPAPATSA